MYLFVIGFCDLLTKFYVQQKIRIAPKQLIYARFDVLTTFLIRFSDLLNLFSCFDLKYDFLKYVMVPMEHPARHSASRSGEAEFARRAGRPRYFQLSTVGRRRTPVKMGTNSPVFQSVTAY